MTPSERSAFEQFLLAEYEHIAKAHFATQEAISAFFKNYLAIVGLPLAAIPLALRLFNNQAAVQSLSQKLGSLPNDVGFRGRSEPHTLRLEC
jgi:hypothetical protein